MAFIDLNAQRDRLRQRLDAALFGVLSHGQFILGPEVDELEIALGKFCGARNVVTCANGTDALCLVLRAWDIGAGDAVFVPSFTFVATAEAVALTGATPVFVDVDVRTFNLDPGSLEAAIMQTRRSTLRPRAVIPVDLFGQPANYAEINDIAREHKIAVLADGAQSFGAHLGNKRVGTLAQATTTSFFPAKPLGCYGDGGAVFTDDEELASALCSLRVHGKGRNKYDNVRVGMNSRLDTLQAAILIAKLSIFEEELAARQGIADRYNLALTDVAMVPHVHHGGRSVWAQYTIKVPDRETVIAACSRAGVPTQVYYGVPLHLQKGYCEFPRAPGGCPNSERLSKLVISLPMHPYLGAEDQDRVISCIRAALGTGG